jgi:probable F420-dependent oxidoreductase
VTDHPFPPHRWLYGGGHHALDPFVALSFAAAATSRLRLQTHILVLPYRNPFLAAKAIASLDVLSGGRVIVGAAAGYLKGEFAALGADFEARQDVSDEVIRAMQLAWAGDDVRFEGRGYRAGGNSMGFRPVQRPHPPLWIGGNSRAAIRRAVELCDGWVPFPNTPAMAQFTRSPAMETFDDLARVAFYASATAVGRQAPLDICYSLSPMGSADLSRRRPASRSPSCRSASPGSQWASRARHAGVRGGDAALRPRSQRGKPRRRWAMMFACTSGRAARDGPDARPEERLLPATGVDGVRAVRDCA